MKRILCLLLLACTGCMEIPKHCPHYYVVAYDGEVEVMFVSETGYYALIKSYKTIKEADEAAKDMNNKIGSACK